MIFSSIAFVLLYYYVSETNTQCPSTSLSIDDQLFYVSNQQVTQEAAEEACSSAGGALAKMEMDFHRIQIIQLISDTWKSGFIHKIWVYARPGHFYLYVPYKTLKNRNYPWTPYDEIPSFFLYRGSWGSYNTPLWFGKNEDVPRELAAYWVVNNQEDTGEKKRGNWYLDFVLFGGNENAKAIRKLYKFYKEDVGSTRLSLSSQSADQSLKSSGEWIGSVDIRIFTGARSVEGETDWKWSDGSKVARLPLQDSNTNVCQQMTLYYNEKWTLEPVGCVNSTAFYICQKKTSTSLMIDVKPDECNGTMLHLSWNPEMFQGEFGTSSLILMKVKVRRVSGNNIDAKLGKYTISNLEKRSEYDVKIKAYATDCSVSHMFSDVRTRTSYGIPDVVTATISDIDTGECVIEWMHQHEGVQYEISAYGPLGSILSTVMYEDISVNVNEMVQMTFNVDDLESATRVSFKIAAYACGGKSDYRLVEGICVTSTYLLLQKILAGILIVILIIFWGVCGYLFYTKKILPKRKKEES